MCGEQTEGLVQSLKQGDRLVDFCNIIGWDGGGLKVIAVEAVRNTLILDILYIYS